MPDELTAAVRVALSRAILQQIFGSTRELEVATLDPQVEQMLTQASATRGAEGPGLEPGLAERLMRQAGQFAQAREQLGQPAVLLVPPALRNLMARFLRRAAPQLKVLSQAEIPDNRTVKVVMACWAGRGRAHDRRSLTGSRGLCWCRSSTPRPPAKRCSWCAARWVPTP